MSFGEALDRHITGNYGEDQFAGLVCCSTCGELNVDRDSDDTECLICKTHECVDCGEEFTVGPDEDPYESTDWEPLCDRCKRAADVAAQEDACDE